MKTQEKKMQHIPQQDTERVEKAERNLKEILEELKPFTKQRKLRVSSSGQDWRATNMDF